MSSPSSAPENSCRITLGQAQQVRPKVPLLRILQAAGAQGDTFTLKEVMHFLGQYIMARQLYDKREQHLVHCGGDALGELLGLQSFSVKDPSPVYEMLKRNLTAASVPTGRLGPKRTKILFRALKGQKSFFLDLLGAGNREENSAWRRNRLPFVCQGLFECWGC
ncbi:protein Mdm4 [Malurus melanocephalus]|uniref:protein Mdm4 n=1 Tax=Malurus melanocephalus TaxID=175006 RepID=UPI002547BF67|nr:protein Mdm4 [Malurus melanocephalus]